VKSFPTLVNEFDIGSIDYLKIDTEGHDTVILKSYFECCLRNSDLCAKRIQFETNQLNAKEDVDAVIDLFCSNFNYRVVKRGEDTVMVR
jgi:hypothetical protein